MKTKKTKDNLLEEVFGIPRETPDEWFNEQLNWREKKWNKLRDIESLYYKNNLDLRDCMDFVPYLNDNHTWPDGDWVWKSEDHKKVFDLLKK